MYGKMDDDSLRQQVVERDAQIVSLNRKLAERDGQLANLRQEVAGLYVQVANAHQQLHAATGQLSVLLESRSWLLTKPLRSIQNLLTGTTREICKRAYPLLESTWRQLPLSIQQRQQFMDGLFKSLPLVFGWTETYRIWRRQNTRVVRGEVSASAKLFDPDYYLAANPDAAAAGVGPYQHYCTRGWKQGRNPHPLFNVAYYLHRYPDVKSAGVNPLDHYLTAGWREGRDPHPVFDAAYYCNAGWYSTECGISPLEYYLQYRCAATGSQLAALDALLPRQQVGAPASGSATTRSTKPEVTPLISILMPTYNTPATYLEATICSVLGQCYQNWELCITDDGSVLAETRQVLERYSLLDSRIKVSRQGTNTGISTATNEALRRARGEFVAMLDHDDTLEPDALLEFVLELSSHPETDAIYSDQDLITAEGAVVSIYYKPDWSPEMMRGVMYVGHLLMVRRSLALDIGGFDAKYDRVQDFEFMLRVGERTDRIRHVAKILYHWRMIPGSIAQNGDAKGKVEPLQCAAVNAHMARLGLAGIATPHPVHAHRASITTLHGAAPPSMTVILGQTNTPEDLLNCLESLTETGTEVEILLPADGLAPISQPGVRVLPFPRDLASDHGRSTAPEFFRAALQEARGDFVLFMEKPMKLSQGWAGQLALYAGRPGVMLVSPLVLNTSGTVAEAGLILHPRLGIEPAMSGWNPDSDGVAGSLSCAREVPAVSAACVCFRRDMLQHIEGFDPLYRIATFQVADVGLKATHAGFNNLYVPTVTATHCGAPPRATPAEECLDRGLFMDRWSLSLHDGDRYHNPNYSPDQGGYAPIFQQ